MEHDNDIDKLLRDAADNFELPYEHAHWAKFQQMQAASKVSVVSKLLSLVKQAKWWMLATVTIAATGIYFAVSYKEAGLATKSKIDKPILENNALSKDKSEEKTNENINKDAINNEKAEALAKLLNDKGEHKEKDENVSSSIVTKAIIPIKEKGPKRNKNLVEVTSSKAVPIKRSARKSSKKIEKSEDEIYMFPKAATNAVDPASISKSEPEKPHEPIESKRGTVIPNKKENTNKVYEDFVVDETPVEPAKKEPVVAENVNKSTSGKNALSDTIFERNLTSTAFAAKETPNKAEQTTATNEKTAVIDSAKSAISHEFSIDAIAGAALYKSLFASTNAQDVASNNYSAELFLGARIEYGLTDRISLFTQPVYQQRSVNATTTATETNFNFDKSENQYTLKIDKLHYVEIPIGLALKLFKRHKIYAGAGVAYLLSTSAKIKQFSDTEAKVQTGYSNGIKNVDYYLLLAYQYEVLRRLKLFAQYQYAPAAAIDKKYYTNIGNSTNTTIKIGVSIGLYNNK